MSIRYAIALASAMLLLVAGGAWAGSAAMPWVQNASAVTFNPAGSLPASGPAVTESSGPGYWCAYISNFTPGTSDTVMLLDRSFHITLSVVSPNYGITLWINNQSYSALRYNHIQLGTTGGINYTMILTNASYTPSHQTAAMSLCGRSVVKYTMQNVTVDAESLSGAYNVSLHHSVVLDVKLLGMYAVLVSNSTSNMSEAVHIRGYNASASVPGYSLISAYNVSVKPGTGIAAGITASYPCSVPASRVQPFVMVNGTWTKVQGFGVNSTMCQASFSVAGDPVVGLFEFVGVPLTTASTTVQYRLVQINNYTFPYAHIESLISAYVVDIIGIIIVIAVVVAYLYWARIRRDINKLKKKGRRGRKTKPQRRSSAHAEAGL